MEMKLQHSIVHRVTTKVPLEAVVLDSKHLQACIDKITEMAVFQEKTVLEATRSIQVVNTVTMRLLTAANLISRFATSDFKQLKTFPTDTSKQPELTCTWQNGFSLENGDARRDSCQHNFSSYHHTRRQLACNSHLCSQYRG